MSSGRVTARASSRGSPAGGNVRISAIVPAAGASRRIGHPKQVLPYRGSTLATTVVRTLLQAGVDSLVVVTRTPLVEALELPDDARVAIALNDAVDSEMIDSIRIGLAWLANERARDGEVTVASEKAVRSTASSHPPLCSAGVIVVPADMPTLSVEACRRCIIAYRADPHRIVIATYQGHRGHPIIFPFSMRAAIDRLGEGLRELPSQYPEQVHLVEIDDPGVIHDVDTAGDYDSLSAQGLDCGIKPDGVDRATDRREDG